MFKIEVHLVKHPPADLVDEFRSIAHLILKELKIVSEALDAMNAALDALAVQATADVAEINALLQQIADAHANDDTEALHTATARIQEITAGLAAAIPAPVTDTPAT